MRKAICLSHIGKRPNHEDNFLFAGQILASDEQKRLPEKGIVCRTCESTDAISLFAISDGMGGHSAGEVASLICVKHLAQVEPLVKSATSIQDAVAKCQAAITEINSKVCAASKADPMFKGMGATLVLLIVFGAEYAVLNIGDSRAYYFDGKSLIQITKDNTEGQRMLDLGILARKELEAFPARKNLNRYIGFDEKGFTLRADEYYTQHNKGIFMLCSDGITDALTDEQIGAVLRSESSLEKAGCKLIEAAVAVDCADNATLILIPAGG